MAKTIYTADQLIGVYGNPGATQAQPQTPTTTPQTQTDGAFRGSIKPDLGIITGAAKGLAQTAKGIADLGDKFLNATGAQPSQPAYQKGTPESNAINTTLQANTPREKLGKGAEQIAELAIPGTKVTKATEAASLGTKALARGLTSGAVVSAQKGEVGKDALIAGGIDATLPVVGKVIVQPAKKLISRILKGTGVALSGASGAQLDEVINNPELARQKSAEFVANGNDKILEKNVKTIFNGVSKIKKDASNAFAEGLDSLSKTDIKPDVFRNRTQGILDKYQVFSQDGQRTLQGVEFTDPKNIQKASDLIDKLQNVDLNGKDLRKLSNEIENSAFKTTGTDAERLSFNQFINDLSNSVKGAINDSTPKLNEINKAYSQEVQLAEAIQKELGNVDYKNLSEVVAASKKLENLFSKQGLAPKVINDFLAKIGATDLKTSEAVRQINTKELTSNSVGTNPFEALRNISAAIVSPKMVKNIAIGLSISEKKASEMLKALGPVGRAAFIKSITQSN